jgi:hypothetical protein
MIFGGCVITYLVWGDISCLVLFVVRCLVLITLNRKRCPVGTTKFVGGKGVYVGQTMPDPFHYREK